MTIEEVYELAKTAPVYHVIIRGYQFFYRLINIGEYVKLKSAATTDCEFEDNVVMAALLYTDAFRDKLPAGIYQTLADTILMSSNFDMSTWQGQIDERKADITPSKVSNNEVGFTNPVIPLIIQVCRAFPAYKPDDLFNLSVDELLEKVAWAEIMLGNYSETTNKKNNTPSPGNIEHGNIGTPKKWSYTQQDLEQMSIEASAAALAEEIRKQAGNNNT